jgi:acetyl-CoA C-acetyltransferase
VYTREAPAEVWTPGDNAVLQGSIDAQDRPTLVDVGEGRFIVEAHTVHYSRGNPEFGIVLGRLSDRQRCVANTRDADAMQQLVDDNCVGREGTVTHQDGLNHFHF